jgi:hypothetical protein
MSAQSISSFEQMQRQLKSSSSTTDNNATSTTSTAIDPITVLKRVEDMRKWQEEQKNMLLQAHEDNLQQFRLEQERISKLLSSSQLLTAATTISTSSNRNHRNELKSENNIYNSSKESNNESTDDLLESLSEQDKHLARLISNQIKMKKINLEAFVDDDDEYDDNNDDENNENDDLDFIIDNKENHYDDESQEAAADNRLSTILEVSCEESPLKAKQTLNSYRRHVLENNLKNKMKSLAETQNENDQYQSYDLNENNNNDDDNQLLSTKPVFDVDSIPIGIKPTNKMTFEQLIEEKLKHADELEQEQLNQRNLKKKPFLKKQSNNKTAITVTKQFIPNKSAPPVPPPPPPLESEPPQQTTSSSSTT